MLGRVFLGPTVGAVDDALGDSRGPIAVVGPPRLARGLRERGRAVLAVAATPAVRRAHDAVRADAGALPIAGGALGAIVAVDADDHGTQEAVRAVARGGVVVLVDRGAPEDAARRALCAGLMELTQREVGRTVLTCGRVAPL